MPPKEPKSPKSAKGKGKKGKKVEEPEPEVEVQLSDDGLADKELDLLKDLNDEFFVSADKLIQKTMEGGRIYEASKIKKYVDLLSKVHRKYVDEVKENEELRPQVLLADEKLRLALDITATSQEAMDLLKSALTDAWKEADASQLREQDIQEKLTEMVVRCESFENKQEEKADDGAELGNLAKHKNIILRERDRLNGEVMDLEKRLQLQRYYSESVEYINKNHEDSLMKMGTKIKVVETEKINMEVKLRTITANLDDQKDVNARLLSKIEGLNKELSDTQSKLSTKISDFDKLKQFSEKLKNENLIHMRTLTKNADELADLRKLAKENDETIKGMKLEDKVKANTIMQLTKKYKKSMQDQSSLASKLYKLNRFNHQQNEEIMRYKNQISALEKDLLSSAQKQDEMRRLKDNMARERDTLRSDIMKQNNLISDLRHQIMLQANNIDSLRMDVNKLNIKLDEAKIAIAKAEKERDEMAQETESLHERIEYLTEQLQLKMDHIADLTEKLQQKNLALINVKKMLESVHSDKMVLQRLLETCTQDRDNFRNLQARTNYQVTQLTNEIAANQNKINSLNMKIERLSTEKKELQSELHSKENILSNVRKDLKDMKMKNDSLLKTINEDELRFVKLTTQLDETRKEKNLIGLQMVRRNDEIICLKETMSIIQTALDQGQTQYNQRVEDIRLLKLEIGNLITERDCLSRAIKSTADMREEIVRLQRTLNQERVKVRALIEDAKTPTAIHRWRIMKGEDPTRFCLLQKVQVLQRRNMKQETDKANLEQELANTRKVVENLKRVIENAPANDIKEQLAKQQRLNRTQLRKIRALTAELALNQVELKACSCHIDKLQTCQELANKALKLQKKEKGDNAPIEGSSVYSLDNILIAADEVVDPNSCFMDCPFTPETST